MDKLVTAILFIGIPMALTQLIYRIIDRKGNKTAKLAERFPVLVKNTLIGRSSRSEISPNTITNAIAPPICTRNFLFTSTGKRSAYLQDN